MAGPDYSLREIKHARTKLALMNAFIERLHKVPFDNISIKEVCKSCEISEGTFFNYFPGKIDIITYFVNLMTLKIFWQAQKKTPRNHYLALIKAFFEVQADEMAKINIKYELISILIARKEKPKKAIISNAEKRLFFPDLAGIEALSSFFPEDFFRDYLQRAQKNGELPATVNIEHAVVSLVTIMAGTLLAVKFGDVKTLKFHCLRHLQMLWAALGASNQKG